MTTQGAPESMAAGAGLFWNPGAISYLSQLLLMLMLTAYLGRRVWTERRQGRPAAPSLLFGLTTAFLGAGLAVSLLHAMAGGGWMSYAMPWLSPRSANVLAMPWVAFFSSIAAALLIQFAYRFPLRLPGSERESLAAGIVTGLLVLVEAGLALRTDIALSRGEAWFRPDWFAWLLNACMVWFGLVFLRQFLHAQGARAGVTSDTGRRGRRAIATLIARPANREATAARGFLVFALLPVAHTAALGLQTGGLLGSYSMDLLICWSVIAQLTGFTLVFLGYLPERSSFLFKLTAISVALLLAAVNGACWIVAPGYVAQFRAPAMVVSGQEIRFVPAEDGNYAVGDVPLAPEPVAGRIVGPKGARVPLSFDFEFYGKTYSAIYVSPDGSIGFDRPPRPIDATFGYGAQPAIYPLLVAVPKTGTTVRVRTSPARVSITRRDRCGPSRHRCYAFQAVLQANGRIDFAYLAVPAMPRFDPFDPLAAPWLMGITPGLGANGPVSASPPLIHDYHRSFQIHLNRLYAPVVPFLLFMVLLLLVGMPFLFRGFLVRPLQRLLRGIRRFRDGDLTTQVRVSFNDEIGYLTESFNTMARSQHDMVHGLEAMVAERVKEVSIIAARNAQLEERDRLSADLHDSVSQTLFSAALLADSLPEQMRRDRRRGAEALARLAQLNRSALEEMRLLLAELRSGLASPPPPGDRITALAREFEVAHGVPVRIEITSDASLPAEVRATFYRIAQESLNNIARHADASTVRVAFEALPGQALLVISDDGRGFDPAAVLGDHLGLQIMQERALRIGATLEIESARGRGTTVTAVWLAEER